MSVRSRLIRKADRAADRAERLRARGGLRNLQKARRLQQRADRDYEIYDSWFEYRYG